MQSHFIADGSQGRNSNRGRNLKAVADAERMRGHFMLAFSP